MTTQNIITLNRLSDVEQLYCLTLSSGDSRNQSFVDLLNNVGEDKLWEFSQSEGATSIVASFLRTHYQLTGRWLEAEKSTEQTITLYMVQLDRVALAFSRQGIPLVALKNSGIARGIFRDLAACPMGDLDVLVRLKDFRKAHEIMLELGYKMNDRSPFQVDTLDEAEQHGGSEYTYKLSDGTTLWFELQWRPVAGRWIQPKQEPPTDELFERSIAIEGCCTRLLSPEDNLMQVCLHTAKHSYVRAPGFRLHTDVDRIVRACMIDWDLFCRNAELMQVKTAVLLSLQIPAALLGTPIPDEVMLRLNSSPWKNRLLLRWIYNAGLFRPHDSKWGRLGYITFNLLLYDTFRNACRGVLPDSAWMDRHYHIKHRWHRPFWYVIRIASLLTRRTRT